jgi:hypothetical protein
MTQEADMITSYVAQVSVSFMFSWWYILQCIYEEYHRPDYNEMLSTVYGLMSKYNVDKVYMVPILPLSDR